MQLRKFVASLYLILFLIYPALAQSGSTISIALIADKAGGLDQSPLIPMLEVQLSLNENIQLLERTEIEAILQEQQLSATRLLERENTIKIGQLLRADAFIILSLENQSEESGDLIRVRLAETAHGLRLLDKFLQTDQSKLEETLKTISEDIEAVMNLLSLPAGNVVPVGIVDIHRVQLGRQYRMLERTLPAMLSVRLGVEPNLIMLEREDLKILLEEKLLTEGEDSQFWSSAILIDGYLQPDNGGLEMTLNIKDASGDNINTLNFPVEPNEPSVAIDEAAADIVQQILNSRPTGKWDLAAEAEQFYQQGQMLANHERYEDAMPLFETAHALQPNNVYYTGALFGNVWISYTDKTISYKYIDWRRISVPSYRDNWNPYYNDLELAELVSLLVRQIRDEYEKGRLNAKDIYNNFSEYFGTEQSGTKYFSNTISIATEQVTQINRINRTIWIETFRSALKTQIINRSNPVMNDIIRARLSWISSDDPAKLRANLRQTFTEYVMPPELGGKYESESQRKYYFQQVFANLEFLSIDELEELTDVNDLLIKTESQKALLILSPDSFEQTQILKDGSDGYKMAKDLLMELKNNDSFGSEAKQEILSQIKNMIFGSGGRSSSRLIPMYFNEQITIWEEMCNLLIEQNDIDSLVSLNPGWRPLLTVMPINSHSGMPETMDANQKLYERYYLLLDRVTKELQNHKDNREVLITMNNIKDFQAEIRRQFPELDVPYATTNLPVTMLLTKQDWTENINNYELNHPTQQKGVTNIRSSSSSSSNGIQLKDGMLYITLKTGGDSGRRDDKGNYKWPVNINFAAVNLEQKNVAALWKSKIASPYPSGGITGLLMSDEVGYLSLNNVGILKFKGVTANRQNTLLNPKLLTEENGLPSTLITSTAQDGDKLWIAYGGRNKESGLGLYDPETENWESIFCSTLKGDSPFSQGIPYTINWILFKSQNELLFNVYGIDFEQSGLWKLNTDTLELEYIWPVSADIYKDTNNNIWLNSTGLMKLESDSERITIIIQPGKHQLYASILKGIFGLDKDLFVPESFSNSVTFGPYYALGNLDISTGAIHDNQLWARLGESQILIVDKGGSYEDAEIIDNDILDGEPVSRFVSTPYGLVAIGEGTVGLIETEGNY